MDFRAGRKEGPGLLSPSRNRGRSQSESTILAGVEVGAGVFKVLPPPTPVQQFATGGHLRCCPDAPFPPPSPSDGWSSMDTSYPAKKLPPILPSLSPIIDDVQSGLLHVLDGHLKYNDTALLLFYAPWCVHSSRAAKTIVAVADRLKEEVWDDKTWNIMWFFVFFPFSGLLHF